MSVAYANHVEESTSSAQMMKSKWVVSSLAPHILFGAAASTNPDDVDGTIHRLLDELANSWPFAKEAKVLLFRASMAGKISADVRARYDSLLPAKKMARRVRSLEEVTSARHRLLGNRDKRGEHSRDLKALRHSKG